MSAVIMLAGFRTALPVLEKEYGFWMENRSVAVTVNDTTHVLNRYDVQVGSPRYARGELTQQQQIDATHVCLHLYPLFPGPSPTAMIWN